MINDIFEMDERTDNEASVRSEATGPQEPDRFNEGISVTTFPPAKRRREEHRRIRVSRACDRCKSRKKRCSGKYPCVFCLQTGRTCRFTAPYNRGKPPAIQQSGGSGGYIAPDDPSSSTDPTLRRPSVYSRSIELSDDVSTADQPFSSGSRATQSETEGVKSTPQRGHGYDTSMPEESTAINDTQKNSPEPLETDRNGHLVGPSSGASFLLRVQRKLAGQNPNLSSNSSIFTFGDLPLPDCNRSFFILPTKEEGKELLERYFHFTAATHRFLHRKTVEAWLEEMYATNGRMGNDVAAGSRVALLFMVFAQTIQLRAQQAQKSVTYAEASAQFYFAAERQLSEESEYLTLVDIQVRMCMCFYLLSQSRLNHCWRLFGTLGHLILALGIHRRGTSREPLTDAELVESECRKRTFWCAYNLDVYLSAALGRPRAFHDEDINQDLPACIDDADMDVEKLHAERDYPLQEMTASIAHFKLSVIMGGILREFYSLKRPSVEEQIQHALRFTQQLDQWKKDSTILLSSSGSLRSLLRPLFQRQRDVLTLAYWHALLLLHRPFLLGNFTSLATYNTPSSISPNYDTLKVMIRNCLGAAMEITKIFEELESHNQLYRAFWFTFYYACCAVVVLYVHALQQRQHPLETYLPYYNAALSCQHRIFSHAQEGTLFHRYGLVLEELRLEVLGHCPVLRQHLQTDKVVTGSSPSNESLDPAKAATTLPYENTNHAQILETEFPHETSSSYPDFSEMLGGSASASTITQIPGWEQFDSLMSGGLGGLDSLLTYSEKTQSWF